VTERADNTIVSVRELSKRFVLHGHGMNPLKRAARRLLPGHTRREHWALRDVNFDIGAGETVALMGVNGSGKSTLLKIICDVMNPTAGTVQVHGRAGGIIELGAGFHQDLTGFENIFLNGTLLGLSRQTIWSRLKAIEDFCELGTFLNSPVRHYSMGMHLRLAFAIAVHTDPDLFVVDEALAVGDGYFQWKCMRKIEELQRDGRTIIFVSHLPEVAESLCKRALWLHDGQLIADGPSSDVVQQYNAFLFHGLLEGQPSGDTAQLATLIPYNRFGTGEAIIRNLRFVASDGPVRRWFRSGEQMDILFDVIAHQSLDNVAVYAILNRPNQPVSFFDSAERAMPIHLRQGTNPVTLRFPSLPLHDGTYYLTIAIGPAGRHDLLFDCHQKVYAFSVVQKPGEQQDFSHRLVNLLPDIKVAALNGS
jgi:ABC-type polysaccharide/polyol phosphate transport system ATPase subunit